MLFSGKLRSRQIMANGKVEICAIKDVRYKEYFYGRRNPKDAGILWRFKI